MKSILVFRVIQRLQSKEEGKDRWTRFSTELQKGIFQPHTGQCIRRFGGIYAYCRYFIDRKW